MRYHVWCEDCDYRQKFLLESQAEMTANDHRKDFPTHRAISYEFFTKDTRAKRRAKILAYMPSKTLNLKSL